MSKCEVYDVFQLYGYPMYATDFNELEIILICDIIILFNTLTFSGDRSQYYINLVEVITP